MVGSYLIEDIVNFGEFALKLINGLLMCPLASDQP